MSATGPASILTQECIYFIRKLKPPTPRSPDRAGLIQGDTSWTWGEIEQRVAAMTAALRSLGLQKGDRLLVHSRNHRARFESCWAAFRVGCV
ncbi:MAG: AMP-binding protein, partial [Rubrivivax sp.]